MNDSIQVRWFLLPLSLLLCFVPVGAIHAETADGLDVDALMEQLKSLNFWIVVAVTAGFGALGGFVYELLALHGMIERPHKPEEGEVDDLPHATHRFVYDLGIGGRLVIGGLAAVVALWVIKPEDTFAWLAIAIVAGSAGISVFRSMQDRLLAVIKAKEAVELKADLRDMDRQMQKVEDALTANDASEARRLTAAARAAVGRRVRPILEQAP